MKSRDQHQFVLAPWEHRGANFDARPDWVTSLEIGAKERTFLLKVKQNALWFREAGRGDDWTFGMLAPLEADSETAQDWARDPFIVEWFEAELRAGNFGRVVVCEGFANYEGAFIFLFGADGRGVAREFWDERGFDFRWERAVELSLGEFLDWPFCDFETLARGLDEDFDLRGDFSARDVPAAIRQVQPLEWICGGPEELQKLTRNLAFWNWSWTKPSVIFHYASEGAHGSAALIGIWDGTTFEHLQSLAPQIQRLSDLFLDYNTPVGSEWEYQDAQGGRNSWEPQGIGIRVQVEPPSAHEKLEAGLLLRQWLCGKVSADEIDALLNAPSGAL